MAFTFSDLDTKIALDVTLLTNLGKPATAPNVTIPDVYLTDNQSPPNVTFDPVAGHTVATKYWVYAPTVTADAATNLINPLLQNLGPDFKKRPKASYASILPFIPTFRTLLVKTLDLTLNPLYTNVYNNALVARNGLTDINLIKVPQEGLAISDVSIAILGSLESGIYTTDDISTAATVFGKSASYIDSVLNQFYTRALTADQISAHDTKSYYLSAALMSAIKLSGTNITLADTINTVTAKATKLSVSQSGFIHILTADDVSSKTGTFSTLSATVSAYIQYLSAPSATIDSLTTNSISANNIQAVYLSAINIDASTISTFNLSALSATTNKLTALSANILNLTATALSVSASYIDNLSTKNLSATNGIILNLTSQNLSADNTYIKNLTADRLVLDGIQLHNGSADSLTITDVIADSVNTENLTALNGVITNLTSQHLSAVDAYINNLTADTASISSAYINALTSDSISATDAYFINLSSENLSATNGIILNLTSQHLSVANLYTTNITADNASISSVYINALTSDSISATDAYFINLSSENLSAASGVITNLTSQWLCSIDLYATNISANSLVLEGIVIHGGGTADNITVTDLRSTNLTTENLSATNGIILNLTSQWLSAVDAYINNLTADNASISSAYINALTSDSISATDTYFTNLTTENLSATSGIILNLSANYFYSDKISSTELYSDAISTKYLSAATATIPYLTAINLSSTNIQTDGLTALSGYITALTAVTLSSTNISSINATLSVANILSTLTSPYITVNILSASSISADKINGIDFNATTLKVEQSVTVKDISAINGVFGNLTATNAVMDYLTVTGINVPSINATSLSGVYYGDGSNIENLDASKITSGTLSAARLPAFTGDITTTVGTSSATVVKLQNQPISTAVPFVGQMLQWNGTTWTPGSVPAGGSGGGGKVYFLNYGTSSDTHPGITGTVHELGITTFAQTSSVTISNIDQNDYVVAATFITDILDPDITQIPAGIWDANIWADTNAGNIGQVTLKIDIYTYSTATLTTTLISTSDAVDIYDPSIITQYIISTIVPQTAVDINDRIYIVLKTKAALANKNITLYFGGTKPSHIHTTTPSVGGSGLVKTINGVFQSPASLLVDADVADNAQINQTKISGLTTALNNKLPLTGGVLTGGLTGTTGVFTTSLSSPALYITTGTFSNVSATNLTATNATLGTVDILINLKAPQLSATSGIFDNLTARNAIILNGSATLSTVSATSGIFDNLTARNVNISGPSTSTSISATSGIFDTLTARNVNILNGSATLSTVSATSGIFDNLTARNAIILNGSATLSTVSATSGIFDNLTARNVNILNGSATLSTVSATSGIFDNLTARNVNINGTSTATFISATSGIFDNLTARNAIILNGSATLSTVSATSGIFDNLTARNVNILNGSANNLTATNLTTTNVTAINLTATNVTLGATTMSSFLTLKGFSEKENLVNATATTILYMSSGNTFVVTLQQNINGFTIVDEPANSYSITLILLQTGLYTVNNWAVNSVSVKWAEGLQPVITPGNGAVDIVCITKIRENYYGFGSSNFS